MAVEHLAAEHHRMHRVGWLRAAVLGANDGIVSTASLLIGVAAANPTRTTILLVGLSGLVAGAMSMAAGEYISVSSQRDTELADVEIERQALEAAPEEELAELTAIYERRGLDHDLAHEVARQLTAHDTLGAHLRDELGLTEIHAARPFQAAWASALAFTGGAALPVLAVTLMPVAARIPGTVAVALTALVGLGALGARAGGAPWRRAAIRVVSWSSVAMATTYAVGRAIGATL